MSARPTGFRRPLRAAAALLAVAALAMLGAANASALPPIRHVFVLVLENESASTTFGPGSPAPYLAQTLKSQGAYLPNYYGIGHESNDNYIAMISGQAPNPQNQADCQEFDDFGLVTVGSYGQAVGSGCVYPTSVQTVADQLDAAGLTWRDYNEDMGDDPSREAAVCGHPPVGQSDPTQKATATDQYATRHDPFVYFHSIIDNTTLCDSHVVNLDLLPHDLANPSTTPNYVFITPNLCDDGHDAPCANGQPGGLTQVNTWLQTWVPRITGSPAFRDQDGLLMIVFDEAATSDASSCCGEIAGPNSALPGITGPGGGVTGAVLLSPCIAPRTVSQQPYNHYAMLRSVEDIFGLGHLGYAGLPGEQSFGSDVFTRPCTPAPVARLRAPVLVHSPGRQRAALHWSGSDGAGPGVGTFTVQVRRLGGRHAKWSTIAAATTRRARSLALAGGARYAFRVRMTDLSGAQSAWVTSVTAVPSGTSVHGGRYRGPWQRRRLRGALFNRAVACSSSRCSFTLRYRGSTVWVVGERGPGEGVIRVSGAGRTRVVHLHAGRRAVRAVLLRLHTSPGRHRLRIDVVRGSVVLEGFASS